MAYAPARGGVLVSGHGARAILRLRPGLADLGDDDAPSLAAGRARADAASARPSARGSAGRSSGGSGRR